MSITFLKDMSAWWLNILIVITFVSCVNSILDVDSHIYTARCRAACVLKMQISDLTDLECRSSYKCSKCWRACCVPVSSLSAPLCADADCVPGSLALAPPLPLKESLHVNDSRARWPRVPGPVVYLVMADGAELCQTLEPGTTLPSAADLATVRVLVVGWHGLVKVYGPRAQSPVHQALLILRSLGLEDRLGLELRGNPQDGGDSDTFVEEVISRRVWKLNVDSVHDQPPLVKGRISWRRYHDQLTKHNRMTSYLVTWSESDGVLQGNLAVNTATATLSLLPDTLYRIQVSLLDERYPNVHSELLVLDTHSFYYKHNNASISGGKDLPRSVTYLQCCQGVDGFASATLMCLALVIAAAWRWRYRNFSPKNKILYEKI